MKQDISAATESDGNHNHDHDKHYHTPSDIDTGMKYAREENYCYLASLRQTQIVY